MTLPPSGQISFYDINIELGRSGTAQIGIDEAESGGYGAINECASPFPADSRPAAINEWYSYNHNATSTQVYSGGFDFSIISCASACALGIDCSVMLWYNTAQTAVYTQNTCQDNPTPGYYAMCNRANCYSIGSGGIVNSITACATTTTTTTTTTQAPVTGDCYSVWNSGGGTSGTIYWTDTTGTSRSGTLDAGVTTYVCSTTFPFESPSAEVIVSSCGNTCTNVCTSLPCGFNDCPC